MPDGDGLSAFLTLRGLGTPRGAESAHEACKWVQVGLKSLFLGRPHSLDGPPSPGLNLARPGALPALPLRNLLAVHGHAARRGASL
jgi:hypothetical protein